MVGHQNRILSVAWRSTSLGGQGMVGHQNDCCHAIVNMNSLGGQGMVATKTTRVSLLAAQSV